MRLNVGALLALLVSTNLVTPRPIHIHKRDLRDKLGSTTADAIYKTCAFTGAAVALGCLATGDTVPGRIATGVGLLGGGAETALKWSKTPEWEAIKNAPNAIAKGASNAVRWATGSKKEKVEDPEQGNQETSYSTSTPDYVLPALRPVSSLKYHPDYQEAKDGGTSTAKASGSDSTSGNNPAGTSAVVTRPPKAASSDGSTTRTSPPKATPPDGSTSKTSPSKATPSDGSTSEGSSSKEDHAKQT